ncbi:MAG: Multidrug resistance efflux pump [Chthonomonadales bacterium]|nr:Multidrug resistance efflux pump [Chthonomonadales bacterium]
MAKKLILGGGLAILIVVIVSWYGVKTLMKAIPEEQRSETVLRGNVEIKVVENGVIEPLKKVDVKSKVGGRVNKLLVEEGQVVQAGQALAITDPEEIDTQVAALRAQLQGTEARLASARKNSHYQQNQTSTNIDSVQQNAESAKARLEIAEAEAKVQPKLTDQSIQIAEANLESARSNLKALQDNENLMVESTHPNAVVTAQSAFEQAKAQADNANRNLTRQRLLLAKGFVAQQAVDSAETDTGVAAAHMREVKDRLDRIERTNRLEENNIHNQIASSKSQVHQLEVALEESRTNVTPLTKKSELASAKAAYRQALAQLESARSGKTQDAMRTDDIKAAEAEVSQIQNQLNTNLIHKHDTTLNSPMTGVVTKRYVEEGEIVTSAIGAFNAGTSIFQISDLATMLIKININEVDIPKVQLGLLTEVSIDSVKGTVFPAIVRKVATSALGSEAGGQGGGSGGGGGQGVVRFPVEIRVNKTDKRLKPGMSARCAIIVARRANVLRLPTNCVHVDGGKSYVMLVTSAMKDGKPVETATKREVVTGLKGDDSIEIISGVKEKDRVRPNPFTGPARKTIDINMGPGGGG